MTKTLKVLSLTVQCIKAVRHPGMPMRSQYSACWCGVSFVEVCRVIEVTQPTYHRWRQQYGGMQGEEARRLTQLEPPLPGKMTRLLLFK